MSSSTTPSIAKRSKTPSTAQPSSIRTRSMSSTTLVNRRGSLPVVKGRRALDLKTINRRYDEDDEDQVAESSKKVVCRGEKAEGAERPTKQARKKSPVKSKGKGKERMKEILGEDAEMGGAASEEDLPEEQKPARFLPIPPRSPVDGHHPSSSTLSNPFQPHGASALPRSSSKYNDIHMGSDDSSSSSDDSMLLMPSPRKVVASPLKPSSLSISTVPSSGIKRSRSHAFEDSPRATSPRKFVPPKTPTIDIANPFYVSPAPKPLPPSLSLASASTSTSSMAATSVVSSPITSSISTTINSLSIRTPQSQRKRAREVFSGTHNSPDDTSAPAPIKSCLSSSSSSGSSPASAKSSDGDGSSPRKRVHFTSPPPPSQINEDDGPSTTASSSSSSLTSKSLDPPSSPPSALNPPMIDIVALTKRKLKSPRKRVMPKPTDGSTLMVRDGAKAVKKLEGLTVPKPFAFGAVRSVSSISSGLSSVAEGKEREKEESLTTKTKGNSLMGPPALPLPRAFGAYASGSTSMVPPPKRIPSSGEMSSSGSRTSLNVLSQSTSSSSSRIPQAPSLSSSINSRPPPSKPSLPTSRSVSSLSSLSNPKRAPIPSSSAIPTISSLSSSTSSRTSKYPSSLGSRPPPSKDRPQPSTARKTSVPVPASAMQLPKPPPRAVSDPVASLTASAGPSRIARGVATAASGVDRKGLSSESRSAMAGLAESLAKMQVRKAAAGVAAAGGGGEKRLSASSTMPNLAELAHSGPSTTTNKARSTAGGRPSFPSSSSSSRVMAPPPNPPSSFQSGIPTSTSNRRLSSNLPTSTSNRRDSSSSSEGDSSFTGGVSLTSSKSTGSVGTLAHQVDKDGAKALSGVVAFVDVRTAEGDEAGGMFVEILRGLGAKVLVRPSDSVTHIIFKAGKSSTLAHYRKFVPAGPAPLAGEEMMALEDLVDLDGLGEESGPSHSGKAPIHMVGIGWVIRCKEEKKRVSEFEYKVDVAEQSNFQKRRKSMEPKQMRAMLGAPAGTTMADSVEKARRRSLLFAPRISSPLKRAYVSAPAESEDEGDDSNMLA